MEKRIGKVGAFLLMVMFASMMLFPTVSADAGEDWSFGGDDLTSEDNDFGSTSTHDVDFITDDTVRMVLESDGDLNVDSGTLFVDESTDRVGIGVTNPAEKLEIDGDILLNTGADREIYVETPTSASNGYDLEIKAGSGYATFEPTTGGDLTLRAGTGGSGVSAGTGGDVYIIGGGHYSFASNIGDVILCADASGTIAGGKVGILTTSPGAILDVRGDAVFNEDSVDYDFRIESDDDANLFFVDGGNDKIGIGTASPTGKLDVNGDDIRIRTAQTPGSGSADGYTGEIAWNLDYIFVCTDGDGPGGGTDTWERVAIDTW